MVWPVTCQFDPASLTLNRLCLNAGSSSSWGFWLLSWFLIVSPPSSRPTRPKSAHTHVMFMKNEQVHGARSELQAGRTVATFQPRANRIIHDIIIIIIYDIKMCFTISSWVCSWKSESGVLKRALYFYLNGPMLMPILVSKHPQTSICHVHTHTHCISPALGLRY